MAVMKTLGGDRLGAGEKRREELPEFGRSTHNQSGHFRSTMAAGVLYPCFRKFVDMNETIDIDISQDIRTLPTKGPLFGSFKTQVDLFEVPFRLYQGILHNNPVNLGMKMNQVYLPKLVMEYNKNAPRVEGTDEYDWQVNNHALLKYLGLSGIGTPDWKQGYDTISRKINAIPLLGYYDIFKNYYANKQEENAYVITPQELSEEKMESNIVSWRAGLYMGTPGQLAFEQTGDNFPIVYNLPNGWNDPDSEEYIADQIEYLKVELTRVNKNPGHVNYEYLDWSKVRYDDGTHDWQLISDMIEDNQITNDFQNWTDSKSGFFVTAIELANLTGNTLIIDSTRESSYTSEIQLTPFALENIDDMRSFILSYAQVGDEFIIGTNGSGWDSGSGDGTGLPYAAVFNQTENNINYSSFSMSGLIVKTYQNDLFNNWIQTDWIEGENGIAELSKVAVTDGAFEIDALLLSKAIYNMLIAVSISGGTYQDWNEARTGTKAVKIGETPIYIGGLTGEIMFEEVVSNAETGVGSEDYQPLGTLGGKGKVAFTKNGTNIHFRATEPCYIMGIVSITPRINQHQGNEWDLTELDTMDDLHKAAFDRIGFQDLITEQMGWFDTQINSQTGALTRFSAGKVPAWSNYTTEVDRTYGDFAKASGLAYMVLNRNYVRDEETGRIADLTTYIDPTKFNYPFAYAGLDANNFWADIYFHVETRRIMSAHNIPHA